VFWPCVACDVGYGLVTLEVDEMTQLSTNISTVADSVVPYNSSMITSDTFYDRLLQTTITLDSLVSFVSYFYYVLTTTTAVNIRVIFISICFINYAVDL